MSKRPYKVTSDGKRKVLTLPVWTSIKPGESVTIHEIDPTVYLLIKLNAKPNPVEILARIISTLEQRLGISKQVMYKILGKVTQSYEVFVE